MVPLSALFHSLLLLDKARPKTTEFANGESIGVLGSTPGAMRKDKKVSKGVAHENATCSSSAGALDKPHRLNPYSTHHDLID